VPDRSQLSAVRDPLEFAIDRHLRRGARCRSDGGRDLVVEVVKTWRIVQHIYENVDREPVLTHVFYGESPEAAQHIFDAHMQTDSFMRGCVVDQRFRDFVCHADSHFEQLLPTGEWTAVDR
jgi:hypothetical protein